MTNKEFGEFFSKTWDEDEKKIEKEFMEAIDSIMFHALKDPDGPDYEPLKFNCYELPMFLKSVSDAVGNFKNLYHIVSVTKGWGKEL